MNGALAYAGAVMMKNDVNISKPGSLYVITAYKFNHVDRSRPIDTRFFEADINAKFYFVDAAGAPDEFNHFHVEERLINPSITGIGSRMIAEWSFLLTELEKPFATYPFYMVSSRFFEKNAMLTADFSRVLTEAFESLEQYGWGYLPSYDRPANFQDLSYYKLVGYLGIKDEGIAYIDGFYGVRYIDQYKYFSDFFCNYIGFHSRDHLVEYVNFYLPFIRRFLDTKWNLINNPAHYVRLTNTYRNEKPFTFLLELISHLFFFFYGLKFSGVSYDGIYEVDERNIAMKPLIKWDPASGLEASKSSG